MARRPGGETGPGAHQDASRQCGHPLRARWKPGPGPAKTNFTNTELGNSPAPQLYDLKQDIGETKNVAGAHPGKIGELKALLAQAKGA